MELHDVIAIVTALICAFWAINAETRAHSQDTFKTVIISLQDNQKALNEQVKTINEKGTLESQSYEKVEGERQLAQDKRVSSDETRITANEAQITQIAPTLARLEEQMNMVTNLLTEQQKRK